MSRVRAHVSEFSIFPATPVACDKSIDRSPDKKSERIFAAARASPPALGSSLLVARLSPAKSATTASEVHLRAPAQWRLLSRRNKHSPTARPRLLACVCIYAPLSLSLSLCIESAVTLARLQPPLLKTEKRARNEVSVHGLFIIFNA